MEENLLTLLEQRETTAKAYIEVAARYNIPIEIFGEKIPILPLSKHDPHNQKKQIRSQIGAFLEGNNEEELNWEELFQRLPDKKLRLAIGLELLRDKVLDESLEATSSQTQNPTQTDSNSQPMTRILDEVWELIKEQPKKEIIYKEWLIASMRHITKGPWSQALDQELESCVRNTLKEKDLFLLKAKEIISKTKLWASNNKESSKSRTKILREKLKDFDPNSPKWQRSFITRIRQEGINLKGEIIKKEEFKAKEIDPNIVIIGERHGAQNNTQTLYQILHSANAHGFKSLSIEEPRSSGWSGYIEFAQSLPKTLNHKPKEIEQKAIEFCNKRGIETTSTAQRLALIHIGRVLDYEIHFVDIDESQKRELTEKRKEKNEKRIIDAGPTDTKDPITALGGPKVFAQSIIETYKDCLFRSKEMSKLIVELAHKSKTIHIGGILHNLDIQHEMSKSMGKKPVVLTIDPKKSDNSITNELGKYPDNNPHEGIYKIDSSIEINKKLLDSIFSGNIPKLAKEKPDRSTETELVIG